MEIKHCSLKQVKDRMAALMTPFILEKEISDGSILYYAEDPTILGDKVGFSFLQIARISYTSDTPFLHEGSEYEILLHGVAYFDGIRHLYFGDEACDNFGYFYYPNLEDIVEVLQELKKLEDKYCIKD